jgi:hypothetical protein
MKMMLDRLKFLDDKLSDLDAIADIKTLITSMSESKDVSEQQHTNLLKEMGLQLQQVAHGVSALHTNQQQLHAGIVLLHADVQTGGEEARQRMSSIHSLLSMVLDDNTQDLATQPGQQAFQQAMQNALGELMRTTQLDNNKYLMDSLRATLTSSGVGSSEQELKAIHSSLSSMREDISRVVKDTAAVYQEVKLMRLEIAKISNMMKSVIHGQHLVPTLMLVVPKPAKNTAGQVKRWFVDKVLIYFVCPMTLRLGFHYELTLPKGWVVKAAPVIKLTLSVLKIALTCVGLPIPIPQLPTDLFDSVAGSFGEMLDKLGDTLVSEVSAAADEHVTSALNDIESSLQIAQLPSATKKALNRASDDLMEATTASYTEIYNLLQKLELSCNPPRDNWEPILTGLTRVTSDKDGTSAWILNKKEVISEFHTHGSTALQIL